jgi:hypothetical protein
MNSEKTCPSATLSTKNPTWPDPSSNTSRRGGKPATNRLNYDTAQRQLHLSPLPHGGRVNLCIVSGESGATKIENPCCKGRDLVKNPGHVNLVSINMKHAVLRNNVVIALELGDSEEHFRHINTPTAQPVFWRTSSNWYRSFCVFESGSQVSISSDYVIPSAPLVFSPFCTHIPFSFPGRTYGERCCSGNSLDLYSKSLGSTPGRYIDFPYAFLDFSWSL